jgi:hypothetical protein
MSKTVVEVLKKVTVWQSEVYVKSATIAFGLNGSVQFRESLGTAVTVNDKVPLRAALLELTPDFSGTETWT